MKSTEGSSVLKQLDREQLSSWLERYTLGQLWRTGQIGGKSLVSVVIFVEGGQGSAKNTCRQAFRIFFEKVIARRSFRVVASGDRGSAFKDFSLALRQNPDDFNILLVDSEEVVQGTPWQHQQLVKAMGGFAR